MWQFIIKLYYLYIYYYTIPPEWVVDKIEKVHSYMPYLWYFSTQSRTDPHSALSRGNLADPEIKDYVGLIVIHNGFKFDVYTA